MNCKYHWTLCSSMHYTMFVLLNFFLLVTQLFLYDSLVQSVTPSMTETQTLKFNLTLHRRVIQYCVVKAYLRKYIYLKYFLEILKQVLQNNFQNNLKNYVSSLLVVVGGSWINNSKSSQQLPVSNGPSTPSKYLEGVLEEQNN